MKLGEIVGKPVFSIPVPETSLVLPYGKIGIEIEVENWRGTIDKDLDPVWVGHEDGSLKVRGREFVTNGGIVGNRVVTALENFCAAAIKHKLDVGYPRAGIHIHVDCTDLDMGTTNQLGMMVSFYLLIEHALYKFAGDWRQWCGFCDPIGISQRNINSLKIMLDGETTPRSFNEAAENFDRYAGLNVRSLRKYGTVEYRHLPTTFDRDRILNWINILLQLKKAAVEWDGRKNLLAEISRNGPREFVKQMLQTMWPVVQPFFDEMKAWHAVDNCIYLTALKNNIAPDWDLDPNPLLLVKRKNNKIDKKKVVKKEAAPEVMAPEQPRAFPDLDNAAVRMINPARIGAPRAVAAPPRWVVAGRGAINDEQLATLTRQQRINRGQAALADGMPIADVMRVFDIDGRRVGFPVPRPQRVAPRFEIDDGNVEFAGGGI